jgi:predicted transcriptional regulator
MKSKQLTQELLVFFKALADENRLKIIALLAQQPLNVEQIAAMLGLTSATVSHHLGRLAQAALVSAKAQGYYSVYQFESGALAAMSKRLLSAEVLPQVAQGVDTDAYDRKVLQTYLTTEGAIRAFPAQWKKEEVLLRHVVTAFEHSRRYSEKEVNEILLRFNEDTARLRRNLVECGLMQRRGGGGEYWRE